MPLFRRVERSEILEDVSDHYEAFRWEGGVMTGLGYLVGGRNFSEAWASTPDGVYLSQNVGGVESFRRAKLNTRPLPRLCGFQREISRNPPCGSVPVPEGTIDNSPAFQRWVRSKNDQSRRDG